MGGEYSIYGGEENCIQSTGGETYCGTCCIWHGETKIHLQDIPEMICRGKSQLWDTVYTTQEE